MRPLIGVLRALLDKLPPCTTLLETDLSPGTQGPSALLKSDLCAVIEQDDVDRIIDKGKNVAAPFGHRHRAIPTGVDNPLSGRPNLVRIAIQSAHHPSPGLSKLERIPAVFAPDMDDNATVQAV